MKTLFINPNIAEIDISSPAFINLIIENPSIYYAFNRYLYDGFPDHLSYFGLQKDGKELKIEDYSEYIDSFYSLNLNSKSNLNALYKLLKKTYFEQLSNGVEELQKQLDRICSEIALDFDVELVTDGNLRMEDIFKMGNIQFSQNEDVSLLNKLVNYIKVVNELRGCNLIFTNHLFDYLEKENIENLFIEASYRGITIINLERVQPISMDKVSQNVIIDFDLCSFY